MKKNFFIPLSVTFFSLFMGITGCSPKEQPSSTNTSTEASMKISGEAFYRERIAVPSGILFEVFLEDVSKADAPATIIGRQQITDAGQPPYQFTIDYSPNAIVTGHRYSLRAQLSLNGELWFVTDQSYPVLVDGEADQTKLLLRRAANPAQELSADMDETTGTTELTNAYWKLVALNQKEVAVSENQREPHLVFTSEMRVHGSDGCNNIGGGYTLNDDQLGFTQMISTMMACIDNEAQAQEFTAALEKVVTYHIDGEQLEFQDESGAVIARFNAVALQ